jgi:hypothetical protein
MVRDRPGDSGPPAAAVPGEALANEATTTLPAGDAASYFDHLRRLFMV